MHKHENTPKTSKFFSFFNRLTRIPSVLHVSRATGVRFGEHFPVSKVAYGGDDRHLHQRGGRWHYQRRVPKAFAHIDPRAYSKKALKTSSLEVARKRRDLIEQADDEWWMALAVQVAQTGNAKDGGASILRAAAEQRYSVSWILRL